MVALGYALLGEEHDARTLVRNAARAEEAGFSFALISDHFHPWTDAQGHSPFVWTTLGAIAQVTDRMVVGTGVTCPTIRVHPAIVAQAAATTATLLPGRFFLGVGTGENLNEHVLGDHWPAAPERRAMLEEAIHVIRSLWKGREWSFRGAYYTVEHARLYTLPETPPPILMAASGPRSAALAGRACDGLVATSPDADLVRAWKEAGGHGPVIGMLHLAYAATRDEGRATLMTHWPHAPLPGHLNADLRRPAEFEGASTHIRPDAYDDRTPQGPDPRPVIEGIEEYERAGFDHVVLHQIGPEQDAFVRFFEREISPGVRADAVTLGRR